MAVYIDLIIILILTIIFPLIPYFVQETGIQLIYVIAYLFFCPGYAIVAALFHNRDINILERVALSIGISTAILPLLGLVLDESPIGLTYGSITYAYLSIIIIILGIGFFARKKISKKIRLHRNNVLSFDKRNSVLITSLTIISLIIVLAVLDRKHNFYGLLQDSNAGTEFFISGPSVNSSNPSLLVTVINHDTLNVDYGVLVKDYMDNSYFINQTVRPEETWNFPILLYQNLSSEEHQIEITLFRRDMPGPYRSLYIWFKGELVVDNNP